MTVTFGTVPGGRAFPSSSVIATVWLCAQTLGKCVSDDEFVQWNTGRDGKEDDLRREKYCERSISFCIMVLVGVSDIMEDVTIVDEGQFQSVV